MFNLQKVGNTFSKRNCLVFLSVIMAESWKHVFKKKLLICFICYYGQRVRLVRGGNPKLVVAASLRLREEGEPGEACLV
jgi:hypothetical protein